MTKDTKNEGKQEDQVKGPIIFYCKDCEKIVDTDKVGRKYVYKCKKCGTKNVAFGTSKSIKSFFRVKEEKKEIVAEAPPKEDPKKDEVEEKPAEGKKEAGGESGEDIEKLNSKKK